MKKTLLTLAVALVAGYAAAETVTTKTLLNRTGWVATACTEHADGVSGYAPAVLDDNAQSYWHSNWESSSCNAAGNKHWLVIDMQSAQTINGFDYLPRPTGPNGIWIEGKAYIMNEAPALTHQSANDLYNGTTQVGSFTGWPTNNNANYRTCTFDNAATGRYLVILTAQQGGGNFSSCAELKPFALETREVTSAVFTPIAGGEGANGTFTKSDGTVNAAWTCRWTPNNPAGPAAKIEVVNGVNNIGVINNNFDLRAGGFTTSTFQISSVTEGWYVSQVTFNAKAANTVYLQPAFGTRTQLAEAGVDFTIKGVCGQPVEFTVSGANTANEVSNIQITLSAIGTDATAIGNVYTQKKDLLALWRPVLGADLYTDILGAIYNAAADPANNLAAVTTAADNKIAEMMTEADGRPIYIQNVRRAGTPYLVSTSATTTNTTAGKTNEAAWLIKKVDGTGVFKLYNLAQGKYINAQGGLDATGADLVLVKNTSTYPGVAFKFNGTTNGLNIDNGINAGTTWGVNDGGSSWIISPLGLTPSEITNGKYVRIRPARAIQKNLSTPATYAGSLLGVASALEGNGAVNADVANISDLAYGLGTIWKVEAVEGQTNKFYLRNLAADFAAEGSDPNYMGGGAGYSTLPSGTNKGQFSFVSAYGAGIDDSKCYRKIPTAVAIFNGTNYVDTNGHNNGMGTWARCDNNWPNNGGLYFFEECTDVEAVKSAYIAKAGSAVQNSADAAIAALSAQAAEGVADFSALVNEITTAKEQVEANVAGITTVGQANLFKTSASNPVATVLTETNVRDKVTAAIAGKYFLIKTRMVNASTGHNNPYVTTNAELSATDLNNNILDNARRGVWKIEAAGEGKVALRNEHAAKYLKQHDSYNQALPLTETAEHNYYVHFAPNRGAHGGFAFTTNGNYDDSAAGVHCGAGIQNLCKWSLAPDASWFDLIPLNADVTPSITANADYSQHTISFGEAETATVPDDVVITVRQISEDTSARSANNGELATYTFHSADVDGGTITINDLPRGAYEVDVPAAFFTVNGKYNAPATFALDQETTGIANILTTTATTTYDLQGRKVLTPTHGLYIRNGRIIKL